MDSLSIIPPTIPIFRPTILDLDSGLVAMVELQSARLSDPVPGGTEVSAEVLAEARGLLARGTELTCEMMRELGLRGQSQGVLNWTNLEYTATRFGDLVLVVDEVSLITPPVGMTPFVIYAMDRKTSIGETVQGRYTSWRPTSSLSLSSSLSRSSRSSFCRGGAA